MQGWQDAAARLDLDRSFPARVATTEDSPERAVRGTQGAVRGTQGAVGGTQGAICCAQGFAGPSAAVGYGIHEAPGIGASDRVFVPGRRAVRDSGTGSSLAGIGAMLFDVADDAPEISKLLGPDQGNLRRGRRLSAGGTVAGSRMADGKARPMAFGVFPERCRGRPVGRGLDPLSPHSDTQPSAGLLADAEDLSSMRQGARLRPLCRARPRSDPPAIDRRSDTGRGAFARANALARQARLDSFSLRQTGVQADALPRFPRRSREHRLRLLGLPRKRRLRLLGRPSER